MPRACLRPRVAGVGTVHQSQWNDPSQTQAPANSNMAPDTRSGTWVIQTPSSFVCDRPAIPRRTKSPPKYRSTQPRAFMHAKTTGSSISMGRV